jgi:hypothetical protein
VAKANTAKLSAAPELAPGCKDIESSGAESPEETPNPLPEKVSRYPEGVKLWTYKSKRGEIIELPLEFNKPDKLWLWELKDQPFLTQTWAWLERAGVPKDIQRQCVSLPDDEYMDMFSDWFSAMGGGATPGE